MLQRCDNPKQISYKNYGAKGIKICDRWRTFENFKEDMGAIPEGMTLERINNLENYEPSNCKWASTFDQANNTSRSKFITYRGETKTISQFSKKYNIPYARLQYRIAHKWQIDDIFHDKKL